MLRLIKNFFLLFSIIFFSESIFSQDLPPIKLDYASYAVTQDGKLIGYYGEKNRVEVLSIRNISRWIIYCLIATEDRDFYNHDGVSLKGIGRAILRTLTGSTQGGSTITM
jgi:membrane carboxypeptidase/penicillin-binding protein